MATATAVIVGVESRNTLARLDAELLRLDLTVEAVMLNEFGEGLDLVGAATEASTEVVTPGRILVIADANRSVVRAWGDVDRPVYGRSALKPLQALPLIETGAADGYGLGAAEIALACASTAASHDTSTS